ncbi:MAG: PAS domain S-box protein [Deltaproteobacteria bacterium]|nr:PAS domain S-box protein [Deltaproteobacteria bacterium]
MEEKKLENMSREELLAEILNLKTRIEEFEQKESECRKTEEALKGKEMSLAETERMARVGSWIWDMDLDLFCGTDESYHILEIPAGSTVTFGVFFEMIHPEDREAVINAADRAIHGERVDFDYRVMARGRIKHLHDIWQAEYKDGKAVSIRGTVQDITERKEREIERERLLSELKDSERMLAEAQKIGRMGDWLWDIEKDKLYFSEEGYNIFCLPVATPISYPKIIEMIHPDDRAKAEDTIRQILSGQRGEVEYRVNTSQGIKHILGAGIAEFKNGRAVIMRGTVLDVTDRKLREGERERLIAELQEAGKALQESEELFRATAETAADAIICIDEPDKIYFWNRKAEEMLGYPRLEVMGKPLHSFVVPERYYKKALHGLEAFFQAGTGPNIGKTVEFQALRKDKTEFPIELSISSMYIGGKWKAVGIIRDITERKRMEEEHIKIQKLESLGLLAGGIAHDFNNILTTILGNIELADTDKDPAEAHNKLLEAQQVVLRAKNLSQQLITFARGGVPVKKTINVTDLIAESICLSIRAVNIKCDLMCLEETWPTEADEVQLTQVLNNIILNAEQAMPKGGTIEIRCTNEQLGKGNIFQLKEGGYVRISIRDTGPGISKENLKRLFEPYFTTKERGSGLGLALAYSIIRNHDGFITVDSEENVGTTFYVYLPASERKSAALSPNGKRRVLVLEDDDGIRRLLSSLLVQIGYSVTLCREGKDTVFKYKNAMEAGEPFDTVIVDLAMHDGMGGKDVMKELVEFDPNVRAIATSGFYDEDIIADYKKYGFKAALHKPYSITELSELLSRLGEARETRLPD